MSAKVSVRTFDSMMWPALTALKVKGGSAANQELLDEVAKTMGLTDEQMALTHGDTLETEVAYRLAWARTYQRDYLRQLISYEKPRPWEKDNYRLRPEYRELVRELLGEIVGDDEPSDAGAGS